jgi:MFS family permease
MSSLPDTSPQEQTRDDSAVLIDGGRRDPWYVGITRYQWLVLAIACAGWVFDVYESQIFNLTSNDLFRDLLAAEGNTGDASQYRDLFFGIFLVGGTIGGLGFGSLADRFGRRPTMIVTILMYSVFSGLTYFADTLWQLAILRLLVSIGIGGEWAVAASLVAEVFPTKARAQASGIFHASSTLGTWMAAIVAVLVGSQWRWAYVVGIAPALLILWVRASVREPERWTERVAATGAASMGRFRDLWSDPRWRYHAILGTLLASIGLGTFWAVVVAGQNLVHLSLLESGVHEEQAAQQAKLAYGILQAAGGGLGLLAFGPISARIGRRPAFVLFQLAAVLIVPVTCFAPQNYTQLLVLLPVFGFLTLGIHAGYAIYFPELFPTNIRATGTSLCFNGGRLLAVPILVFSGWLKSQRGVDLGWALSGLSLLFIVGAGLALALPETRSQPLPE